MATRRRRFDDRAVARLKPKPKRYTVPDNELIGHYVRVMPTGIKSFVAVARDPFGKQIWTTIGTTDHTRIEQAREQARAIIARVKAGKSAAEPKPPAPDSFAVVAENWLKRHVQQRGLRSEYEIRRCLNKYVLPHWTNRPFAEIRRSDTARLLDFVQDSHGDRQSDAVFTILNSICNWYVARDDDFVPFTRRGMKRAMNRPRERTLTDAEIKTLWEVCEENSDPFARLLQIALLTGQRLNKLLNMRWRDVAADGTWSIATETREKGNAGELVLPELARAVLRRLPRIYGNDLIFPSPRSKTISVSRSMAALRAKLPKQMPQWSVHDLRRSHRSLLARCGVADLVAERVLGHHVGNQIERTYNRFDYRDEKADALRRLAALIERIVSGKPSDKTVPMRARS